MPVYKLTIKGDEKVRLIRADSAAKARDHVVDAVAVKADEMADLLAEGAVMERAGDGGTPPPANGGSKE